MRSRGDVARRGEGDRRGSSEYFEWGAVGTDCGVFAGGAGGQFSERIGNDGYRAGRKNRRRRGGLRTDGANDSEYWGGAGEGGGDFERRGGRADVRDENCGRGKSRGGARRIFR